ncbi:flagellar hook-length control protein FliK [Pseudomonas sp. R5(2019)]|uniref:flagellar hook-length control protein FliK n=1 Tax=Pseudomonas sp. R5(2019) TaxID=2697566 RepID=UPI0014130AC8|nr:flagellar hook-length control protein FliK [Pseudomonas sp. R5(2019)]NBA93895.1 flagellar hook-length control protein FliK [Pseudomonas sp. R5(2019)]
MTGEINSLNRPLPPASAARSPAVAGEPVKLLQALPGLLAVGESASAEVMDLKQTAQDFQLLLRLTLANGRQTNVQASSLVPLLQGTQVAVTRTSSDTLALLQQQSTHSSVAALTTLDLKQLPVGTLLQGKVLTSQLLPQTAGQPPLYRALLSLLNTAQAGATLSLDSPRPLALGSLLSAQVQGPQALLFMPLSGRLDQLALVQNLGAQGSRQGSLQGLFNALQRLEEADALPAEVRAAADKLVASLPDISKLTDARGVAQAMANSGVFLEANLLGGGTAQATDLKAHLLRLVAQILPGLPANTTFNPAAVGSTLAQVLPGMVRNALGMLGQVGPRGPAGGFPLPTRLLKNAGDGDLEHLLKLAAAAVSRLQTHQLSSLEKTGTTPDGNLLTTWQLEIPLRSQQDILPLQVKLQREETPEQQAHPERERRDAKELLWRVELAFDVHPLGPLQVQAQLVRGSLSSQLWAEHPATAQLIEGHLGYLRDRLVACGLTVAELDCHQGTPPQGPRTQLQQRWVDETA